MDNASDLVGLLVGILVGFRYGRGLKRKGIALETVSAGRRGLAMLGGFATVLLVLVGASRSLPILPPVLGDAIASAAWGLVLGFVAFIGTLWVALGRGRSAKTQISGLVAFVVSVGSILGAKVWVTAPVWERIGPDRVAADGTILQTLNTSCTAAALANLLPRFGIRATERECARVLGTNRFGTTLGQVVHALNKFGLDWQYVRFDPNYRWDKSIPILLSIRSSGYLHTVVLYGADENSNHLILDPLAGRIRMTRQELASALASPYCLLIGSAAIHRFDCICCGERPELPNYGARRPLPDPGRERPEEIRISEPKRVRTEDRAIGC